MMQSNVVSQNPAVTHARFDTVKTALVALVLGFGLFYVVGFATPASIHDAAHDSRHALSFPCH